MRHHQDSCAKYGGFWGCRFNCVSEICVRPTPVAMVTKILKFPHKNHNNSGHIWDRYENFAPNWGFWGCSIRWSHSNFR